MQRWEYLVLTTGKIGGKQILTWINDNGVNKQKIEFYSYLNKLGNDGWEVVAANGEMNSYANFVLKRPKE